jgi:hypothetical protein
VFRVLRHLQVARAVPRYDVTEVPRVVGTLKLTPEVITAKAEHGTRMFVVSSHMPAYHETSVLNIVQPKLTVLTSCNLSCVLKSSCHPIRRDTASEVEKNTVS